MAKKKLISALTAIAFTLSAAAGASSVIVLAEEVSAREEQVREPESEKRALLVESVAVDLAGFEEEIVEITLPEGDVEEEDTGSIACDSQEEENLLHEIRLAESSLCTTSVSYVDVGNVLEYVYNPVLLPYIDTACTNNERALWDFFKSLGFTDAGAAASMANLSMESGLNPGAMSSNFDFQGQKGGAGLAGWMSSGRLRGLIAMAKAKQVPWQDLSLQMAYLQYELQNTRKQVGEEMKVQTNVDYATDYFCVYFEGCIGRSLSPSIDGISVINGKWYQGLAKRKALAQMYYERYAGNN